MIINLFLLVVGCFFETIVAILILGPILMQVVTKVGIDPVHFGVVMVLNLMIGLLTPPFGVILFVMVQVGGTSPSRTSCAATCALPHPAAGRAVPDHDLATAGHLAAESRDGLVVVPSTEGGDHVAV